MPEIGTNHESETSLHCPRAPAPSAVTPRTMASSSKSDTESDSPTRPLLTRTIQIPLFRGDSVDIVDIPLIRWSPPENLHHYLRPDFYRSVLYTSYYANKTLASISDLSKLFSSRFHCLCPEHKPYIYGRDTMRRMKENRTSWPYPYPGQKYLSDPLTAEDYHNGAVGYHDIPGQARTEQPMDFPNFVPEIRISHRNFHAWELMAHKQIKKCRDQVARLGRFLGRLEREIDRYMRWAEQHRPGDLMGEAEFETWHQLLCLRTDGWGKMLEKVEVPTIKDVLREVWNREDVGDKDWIVVGWDDVNENWPVYYLDKDGVTQVEERIVGNSGQLRLMGGQDMSEIRSI